MEEHNANRGDSGMTGGAANTPPFGSDATDRSTTGDDAMSAGSGMSGGGISGGGGGMGAPGRSGPGATTQDGMEQGGGASPQQAIDMARDMAGERVEQVRGQVEDRVNQGMRQAADRLQDAAGRIDSLAEQRLGGESGARARAGQMAHTVADTMESVAGYLRDNDVQGLRSDLERQVRERPLETLLMGVAAGWIVGKILR